MDEFQSTLSVRRATILLPYKTQDAVISIHALRKESDLAEHRQPVQDERISIHALRKESDIAYVHYEEEIAYFNPRSP